MITVTQILGTDAMNASRITINENFSTVASAINTLQNLVSANQIGTSSVSMVCSSLASGGNITCQQIACQQGLTIGSTTLSEQQLASLIAMIP